MKILAKTTGLSKEAWLGLRNQGIGGSDVSIIAGINPYKSIVQLWMEKRGLVAPDLSENDFTHFGTILEPIVKKEFMTRTGWKVRAKKCIIQHPKYPFMLANLDGVVYEQGIPCIFEAKTASAYKQKQWEHHVPEEYLLQIQHYMAVTGMKKAYIAALIGGNHFCYHMVERDEELIELIMLMEREFWEDHVLANIQPSADGSKATADYINRCYPSSRKTSIELPKEMEPLFGKFDQIQEQMEVLVIQKEQIINQFKEVLKENEQGVVGERCVRWTQMEKRSLDSKRLEQENPLLFEQYVKRTSYRKFSVA